MRIYTRASGTGGVRSWFILPFAVIFMATGCMEEGIGPPTEGRLAIEGVAKWYQLYRADNGGKTPPDEKTFVAYVESKLKERGDTLDRDQLLKSPRDGEKYVIRYGVPNLPNVEENVVVYEKVGYGDKKLVGFDSGAYVGSREVDEAELKSLLAGK